MRKVAFFNFIILFLISLAWAQEKVEAPVLNVGDKWTYRADNGWEWTVETIGVEKDSYVIVWLMPEGGARGEWKQFYDKKSLNCVKVIKDGKEDRDERNRLKKWYDFPLHKGKKWKFTFSSYSYSRREYYDAYTEFLVGGFEDIEVPAGKFKAIKVRGKLVVFTQPRVVEGFSNYWWSPEVKAVIKEEKEVGAIWSKADYMKYELISFGLK